LPDVQLVRRDADGGAVLEWREAHRARRAQGLGTRRAQPVFRKRCGSGRRQYG
jgi:hypothetical protein